MLERLRNCSLKATQWLRKNINQEGELLITNQDLGCYYKIPYALYVTGNSSQAHQVIDYIKKNYLQESGDIVMSNGYKSANGALNEFWAYTTGWVALAAQKMGRFDVSYPTFKYLDLFYSADHGGFATHGPWGNDHQVLDILTTAHLGLLSLYMGDSVKAKHAGKFIQQMIQMQETNNQFYLRMSNEGKLIKDFSEEAVAIHTIDKSQPEQLYFMLGYPVAFLCMIYSATNDASYLASAKEILEFTFDCHKSIRQFHFSHKLAWAAAKVYSRTNEKKYLDLSLDIVNFLIDTQDEDGTWCNGDYLQQFDQTAELVIWFSAIQNALRSCDF